MTTRDEALLADQMKRLGQQLEALTRAAGSMAKTSAFSSSSADTTELKRVRRRGSAGFRDQENSAKTYDKAASTFFKMSGQLTSEMKDANKTFSDLSDSWSESAELMFRMNDRITKWGDDVGLMSFQAGKLVKGMSRFQTTMAQATKAQSMLYAEQLKNISGFKQFEKIAYLDELSKSISALSTGAKKQLGVLDEATGQLRKDLDLEDFSKIRKTLGEAQSSMKEALSGSGFKSFMEMANAGKSAFDAEGMDGGLSDARKASLAKSMATMQAMGLYRPSTDSLSVLDEKGQLKDADEYAKIDWEGLTKNASLLEESFKKTAEELDKNVDIFNNKVSRFLKSIKNGDAQRALMKMTASYLASGAAFEKAWASWKHVYTEATQFNDAEVPATYLDVNKAAVQLGLTFDQTVKLMQENKRLLAIYGPEQFTSAMKGMQGTFEKYGYNMQQAAEMVGPTVQSAISAGINVRDFNALNSYTDKMTAQFKQLSGMVNISASEFAQLNDSLFKSDGTFETMLGLNQQQKTLYADDLVQSRKLYVQRGLELQQAQALVEAQQQQQRGHVNDRVEQAAKLAALAQTMGMGSSSMELFNLARKGRRSATDNARLQQLLGQLGQTTESSINQGYGSSGYGSMGDMLNEARLQLTPDGQLGQMYRAGEEMNAFGQAHAQITNSEGRRAAALATGSPTLASFNNVVNEATSLINNSFIKAIGASSLALVALVWQAGKLAKIFGSLGGLGGFGGGGGGLAGDAEAAAEDAGKLGRFGKIGKWMGRAGGVLGKVGNVAGLLGGGLMAWQGINSIDAQQKAGKISSGQALAKKSGVIGSLGGGLAGAEIGAGIGSAIFPGVGTLVGGLIGGIGGGLLGDAAGHGVGYGINALTTPGVDTGSITPGANAANINTPAATVNENSVEENLQIIATNMMKAVDYLQQIAGKDLTSASKNLPAPTTTYDYLTGRRGR